MITSQQSTNKKPRVRYYLAKASERIFARFVDAVIVSLILIGFWCLIFLTDPNFKGTLNGFYISEPFRYLIFSCIYSIVCLSYFVLLPYLWKGQTVGLKIFKLALINQVFSHYLWNIIRKEFFIWILGLSIHFIFWLCLFIVGIADSPLAASELLSALYKGKIDISNYNYLVIIFSSLNSCWGLIFLVIIINTCMRSQKQTWLDRFSSTVIVKTNSSNSTDINNNLNKKKNSSLHNYSLPGVIVSNPNKEIETLEE